MACLLHMQIATAIAGDAAAAAAAERCCMPHCCTGAAIVNGKCKWQMVRLVAHNCRVYGRYTHKHRYTDTDRQRIHLPHVAIMATITHPIIQLLLHLIYNFHMASELLFTARGILFRNLNAHRYKIRMRMCLYVCLFRNCKNQEKLWLMKE